MKKVLTIILSVTLVMSLFCAVPVQARVLVDKNYYIEDFEVAHDNNLLSEAATSTNAAGTKTTTVSRASGMGYGGSDYALRVDITSTTGKCGNTRLAFNNEIGKVNPGEKLVITMKVRLLQQVTAGANNNLNPWFKTYMAASSFTSNANYYTAEEVSAGANNFCKVELDGNSTEWQTLTFEYDYRTESLPMNFCVLMVGGDESSGNGLRYNANETASVLIDDIEVKKEKNHEAADAVTPAVSNLTAEMSAAGVITASYDYTENDATVDTHQSFWRVVTADGGVLTCASSYLSGAYIPAAYRAQKLYYEVVPVSANGDIGEVVRVTLKKLPQSIWMANRDAEGIAFNPGSRNAENWKLIFVTYDDDDRMVDSEIVTINQYYGETEYYKPADLEAGTKTKVMLWQDMSTLKPLYPVIDNADAANWVSGAAE